MAAASGPRSTAAAGTVAAVLGGLAALPLANGVDVALSAALAGTMGAIAAEDLRSFRVPDPLNLLAAAAGFAAAWIDARHLGLGVLPALGRAALQALACGGALFLLREAFFRLRGVDGLGLGDVKLAAVGGLWLGVELFAGAVLIATFGALAFVAVRRVLDGVWPRDRRLPLALYLAPATWLVWFLARFVPFP